jgi:hypothetical protein
LALIHLMRPSLRKGAHAALSNAAWQEIRVRFGRDDKFVVDTGRNFCNKFVISIGEVMGLDPTQGDEKPGPVTTLYGSAPLPFVIPTEAQRSGEISVLMLPLGNVLRQSRHGPMAHLR